MYCKSCHYNLHALPTPTCPECGRPFNPNNPSTFSKHTRQWPRRILKFTIVMTTIIVLWNIIPKPTYHTRLSICRTCGTQRTETRWSFQNIYTDVITISPLKDWLDQNNQHHDHHWNRYNYQESSLFGTSRMSSNPAEIFQLKNLQTDYINAATDQQIQTLINTLQSGSDVAQQTVINQAANLALNPQQPPTPPSK